MKHSLTRLLLGVSTGCFAFCALAETPNYRQPDELMGLENAPGGFSTQIIGSQEFSYDTNPLRVSTGERSLWGSTTSPELILRDKTPMAMIQADTRIDANYFNRSEFDSVDLHENLYLKKQNERWTASLRGVADYDTTRSSEITNFGLNLPKVRSTRLGATPQIEFHPNDVDNYILKASVSDQSYDNNAFIDYTLYNIAPTYEHKFDPKNKGIFSLNAERYETTGSAGVTSDSIGPSIGWAGLLTPRLSATVTGGFETTDQSGTGAGNQQNNINYVFSGNINFKGRQDRVDASALRAQEPFGNGTQTLLTSFSVTERHAINEVLSVAGTAGYQYADYDSTPGINFDSGIDAGGGIAYRAFDNIDLTADYRFRNETLTNISGDINQHIFMLGVTFHPLNNAI